MKKILSISVFLLLLAQTSCTFRQGRFDTLWFYTYSSGVTTNEDSTLTPACFLDLRPDNTYSLDLGGFDYGHWERQDSMLVLRSSKGIMASFFIDHYFGNELRLGKGTILNFESRPAKFSSPADNPFSEVNNRWRITAAKKESDQEIKNRLKNHCKFYELYFRWALESGMRSVDVQATPSLFNIYGNGLGLKNFEELPALWHSYFFDEEDCRKASDIIKDVFEHKHITWANTENRFKMFVSAFQQLQQLIR